MSEEIQLPRVVNFGVDSLWLNFCYASVMQMPLMEMSISQLSLESEAL